MCLANGLAKKRKPDSATPLYFKLIAGIAVSLRTAQTAENFNRYACRI